MLSWRQELRPLSLCSLSLRINSSVVIANPSFQFTSAILPLPCSRPPAAIGQNTPTGHSSVPWLPFRDWCRASGYQVALFPEQETIGGPICTGLHFEMGCNVLTLLQLNSSVSSLRCFCLPLKKI